MKHSVVLLFLLIASAVIHAEDHRPEATAQKKFVSGGTIRLHLESGGYTISPSDSDNIVVTYRASSQSQLQQVRVDIQPSASSAEVYIADTPNNKFEATIEVPRRSNLWVRLTAGELDVEAVEGDKNLEIRAGAMQVDVPHPEQYGHREASVTMGSLESTAFDVSKGGMFRSFEQQGPGKYRLHAHVLTGDINLRGTN
jgi:hypothetical protein